MITAAFFFILAAEQNQKEIVSKTNTFLIFLLCLFNVFVGKKEKIKIKRTADIFFFSENKKKKKKKNKKKTFQINTFFSCTAYYDLILVNRV